MCDCVLNHNFVRFLLTLGCICRNSVAYIYSQKAMLCISNFEYLIKYPSDMLLGD